MKNNSSHGDMSYEFLQLHQLPKNYNSFKLMKLQICCLWKRSFGWDDAAELHACWLVGAATCKIM